MLNSTRLITYDQLIYLPRSASTRLPGGLRLVDTPSEVDADQLSAQRPPGGVTCYYGFDAR